jgi:hypothetical protein
LYSSSFNINIGTWGSDLSYCEVTGSGSVVELPLQHKFITAVESVTTFDRKEEYPPGFN